MMPYAQWPKLGELGIRLENRGSATVRMLASERFPQTIALPDAFFEVADKSAVRVDTGAGEIMFLLCGAYARYRIVEHAPEVNSTLCELVDELVF